MADTVTHIAGTPVAIGTVHRQLCCWCGAVIQDDDWSLIACSDGAGGPSPWPVGGLIRVGARFKETLRVIGDGYVDPDEMPPDWCGAAPLPDNVVRMRRG